MWQLIQLKRDGPLKKSHVSAEENRHFLQIPPKRNKCKVRCHIFCSHSHCTGLGSAMIKHLLSRENVCIRTSAMGGEVSFPLSTVKNRGCGSSSGMVIRSSMCPFPVILLQLFKNIKKHSYEVSRRCSKGIEQIEKYLFN